MRKRLPVMINGRDVRFTKIAIEDMDKTTIKDVWEVMHTKRGDGKWWSLLGGMNEIQLKKIERGMDSRIWKAGYNEGVVKMCVSQIDGVCFRWSCQEGEYPGVAENKRERQDKHAQQIKRRRHELREKVLKKRAKKA